MTDEPARDLLDSMRDRYGRELALGCSKVAHRDLGFCSLCVPPADRNRDFGILTELSGWRLLAMAERGFE